MRAILVVLLALFLSACGGVGNDTGVVTTSCSGLVILTSDQINVVRSKFPRFEPEFYCGADVRNPSAFVPGNYTPARFMGGNRHSAAQVTPLGIVFETNGFEGDDVQFALPSEIDYFDLDGQPFTVHLPPEESDRQIRVTASEIDKTYLAVKQQLLAQFPQFPEMQRVSPSSINVRFQATVFYVAPLGTWAGGVTSGDGRSIDVALFHLSPRVKVPISWRGIPGVSSSWLAHEIRNAIFIQSGHPELAN